MKESSKRITIIVLSLIIDFNLWRPCLSKVGRGQVSMTAKGFGPSTAFPYCKIIKTFSRLAIYVLGEIFWTRAYL